MLGRGIINAETGVNPARVVVISDRIWSRRFKSDASALGRSLIIDGDAYTVVGVMSPAFEFPRHSAMPRDIDVWVPRAPANAMMMRRGTRDLTVIARLRDGVTLQDAQNELTAVAARAAVDDANLNGGWQLRATSLRDVMIGRVRPVLTNPEWLPRPKVVKVVKLGRHRLLCEEDRRKLFEMDRLIRETQQDIDDLFRKSGVGLGSQSSQMRAIRKEFA